MDAADASGTSAAQQAPVPAAPWTERRPEPRQRVAISRDRIAEIALKIIDTEGTEAVSMRRIASELGTGAASLYAYVSGKDEVLRLANDSVFGLGAYVHTRDSSRLQRMVNGLQAGTVVANGMGGISPATPFGGYKQSGFGGRDNGLEAFDQYTEVKTTWIALG